MILASRRSTYSLCMTPDTRSDCFKFVKFKLFTSKIVRSPSDQIFYGALVHPVASELHPVMAHGGGGPGVGVPGWRFQSPDSPPHEKIFRTILRKF